MKIVKVYRSCKLVASFLLAVVLLVACRDKAVFASPDSGASYTNSIAEFASAYLQSRLYVGEDLTNVITQFGNPFFVEKPKAGKQDIVFSVSDRNIAAKALGLGGFQAWFTSNKLTQWFPTSVTWNPRFESSSIKSVRKTFNSN